MNELGHPSIEGICVFVVDTILGHIISTVTSSFGGVRGNCRCLCVIIKSCLSLALVKCYENGVPKLRCRAMTRCGPKVMAVFSYSSHPDGFCCLEVANLSILREYSIRFILLFYYLFIFFLFKRILLMRKGSNG